MLGGRNVRNKVKKLGMIRQDQKTLISTFMSSFIFWSEIG